MSSNPSVNCVYFPLWPLLDCKRKETKALLVVKSLAQSHVCRKASSNSPWTLPDVVSEGVQTYARYPLTILSGLNFVCKYPCHSFKPHFHILLAVTH